MKSKLKQGWVALQTTYLLGPLQVQASNLEQTTSVKITSEALGNFYEVMKYLSMVSLGFGFLFTMFALAINAYRQSKAIQEGNSSQSMEQWKQMGKIIRNVAILTFMLGIFAAIVIAILRISYPDIIAEGGVQN